MSATEQYSAVGQALVDLPGELYKFTENNRQTVSMVAATMILVELEKIGVLEAPVPSPGLKEQRRRENKSREED